MIERDQGFKSELQISPKQVTVLLLIATVALLIATEQVSGAPRDVQFRLYRILLSVAAFVTWLLDLVKPRIGRWFVVAALIGLVILAHTWLAIEGTLALLAVPTGLAAAMISVSGAAVVALIETVLLLAGPAFAGVALSPATIAVALTAVWSAFGVMCAAYYPVKRIARWSWAYYQQALRSVQEAQDRQLELEQALRDLVDANRQLRRLDNLAQSLRQAAEDARTAKQQFVANVSHELRTPLNMITGFCEMIMRAPQTYGDLPPALLADLEVIYRNAGHLTDLINDVLDLSQIEARQMALTKEFVAFDEVVNTAVVAVRPLFDAKGLYLETAVDAAIPPVFCDRTRMREVILNLLSNAGRFTERGGVRLSAWQEGQDIVVGIADTGPGIASEDIDRAFQPFQQLDSSIRRRYGGSGLGLSISKQFVEMHGGKIWIESAKGVGTTVYFRIPVAPSVSTSGGWSQWTVRDWEFLQRTRGSKAPSISVHPRLVVLDPEGSLCRLLARHLSGPEIVPVQDMDSAVQQLSETPAQALLINGPSVSGTLEELNPYVPLLNGTPALICTVPGAHQAADTLGVSDYLIKPVSRDDLLAAVDRLDLKGNTIMIVDDEPEALQLFRRMLLSAARPYRVLRAENGREALQILQGQTPDAILLDLVMPGLDGFQLLEIKGRDPALRDIPTIVLSARDPMGQPIVSNALAITQSDGLSVHHLLTLIGASIELLSPLQNSRDVRALPAEPPG